MEEKCTCGRCPVCGKLSKEIRGCEVCSGAGPEPGKVYDLRCPVHGHPEIPTPETPLK